MMSSEFPTDLLPPALQQPIRAQSALGNYPVESVATGALAMIAMAAQQVHTVNDPRDPGRYYPTSQSYMMIAGDKDAKSSVYRSLLEGVTRWEEQDRERFESEAIMYDVEVACAKREGSPPPKPPRPWQCTSSSLNGAILKALRKGHSYGVIRDRVGSMLTHSTKLTPEDRLSALVIVHPTDAPRYLRTRSIVDRCCILRPTPWQPVAMDQSDPAVLARRAHNAGLVREFNQRIHAMLSASAAILDTDQRLRIVVAWDGAARRVAERLVDPARWDVVCRIAGGLAAFVGGATTPAILNAAMALVEFYDAQEAR